MRKRPSEKIKLISFCNRKGFTNDMTGARNPHSLSHKNVNLYILILQTILDDTNN